MRPEFKAPLAGALVAIAITGIMDISGYTLYSAFILIPLFLLFWYLQRFSRSGIGLIWGDARSYLWAIGYPLLVLGAMALIATLLGAVDAGGADWSKTLLNIAVMSSVGVIIVTITEEGFFRGWLWASGSRAGLSDHQLLVVTTLTFVVWHLPAIVLTDEFSVPLAEVPIYLVNATLLGLIWGALRMVSGSIVVASVCHALWNGLNYPLFGYGEKVGALGIQATHIFGPEVGVFGILLNGLFFAFFWRYYVIPNKPR